MARARQRAQQNGLRVGQQPSVEAQVQEIATENPNAIIQLEIEAQEAQAPNNPLNEEREARIAIPTLFHGDPVFETVVNNFLLMCEERGWENTLMRGARTNFLRDNTESFFAPDGPFAA